MSTPPSPSTFGTAHGVTIGSPKIYCDAAVVTIKVTSGSGHHSATVPPVVYPTNVPAILNSGVSSVSEGVDRSCVSGTLNTAMTAGTTPSIGPANSPTGLVLVKRVSSVLTPALTSTGSGTLLDAI